MQNFYANFYCTTLKKRSSHLATFNSRNRPVFQSAHVSCDKLFFKWSIPSLVFHIFSSFQTNISIIQQIYVNNVHPVYGAGLRTHDVIINCLPFKLITCFLVIPKRVQMTYTGRWSTRRRCRWTWWTVSGAWARRPCTAQWCRPARRRGRGDRSCTPPESGGTCSGLR